MACSILDLISGGSYLPHVYCKKIVMEDAPSADGFTTPDGQQVGGTKITLNLEILQSKKDLFKSSWLTSLSSNSSENLSDYMMLQIMPFQNYENVIKLDPTYEASRADQPGNVYTIYGHPKYRELLGTTQTFLPLGGPWKMANSSMATSFPKLESAGANFFNLGVEQGWQTDYDYSDEGSITDPRALISLGNILRGAMGSGVLGCVGNDCIDLDEVLPPSTTFGETIIDGRPYYRISFPYTFYSPSKNISNLGFLFFAFLNPLPFIVSNSENFNAQSIEVLEGMLTNYLSGPVNTEILFLNGSIKNDRKQFFLSNGNTWNGSVHLHVCDLNPSPDGYCGDGSAVLLPNDPAQNPSISSFRGWMAGEKHAPNAPRLRLMTTPNHKIHDFRMSDINANKVTDWFDTNREIEILGQSVGVLSSISDILSPFQKETKKYLSKIDFAPGPNSTSVSAYDNDSEYSKLYITRDKSNNARGVFLIDFERMLRNNSVLYPLLTGVNTNGIISSCLGASQLIDLKVYRDRVKKRPQGKTYEKYANDTSYEEPSYLVGSIKDASGYGTPDNSGHVKEIQNLHMPEFNNFTHKVRCFAFTDSDVGKAQAGLYQYRVEISFKDGTHEFLNSVLSDLMIARVDLQAYHTYSLGSRMVQGSLDHKGVNIPKTSLEPWYQNGEFIQEFSDAAYTKFPTQPWQGEGKTVLSLIYIISQQLFDSASKFGQQSSQKAPVAALTNFANLMHPTVGSPQGIEFVIRFADTMIDHLQKLIGSTKVNKTGSEIDSVSLSLSGASSASQPYNFNNFFAFSAGTSQSLIEEYHTFDGPTELHKALSNEDIYIDYLSAGTAPMMISGDLMGPIILDREYYVNRCILDSLRLTTINQSKDIFDGVFAQGKFDMTDFGYSQIDSFNKTGYSFLMPSIIELSAPGESESFNFLYHAFSHYSSTIYNVDITSLNMMEYDRLMLALMTYAFNKEDDDDSDLLTAFYVNQQSSNVLREAYKNLFNTYGLTIHSQASYDDFFNKDSGAQISVETEIGEVKDLLPLFPDDFSDGTLNTEFLFKRFYADKAAPFNNPIAKIYELYNPNLPNILKMPSFIMNTLGSTNSIATEGGQYYEQLSSTEPDDWNSSPDNNSYFFLHSNMITEVQVYTGKTIFNSPLKNDEQNWTTVNQSNIESLNGSYFCRLVLYDPQLASEFGRNMPIINKYFFISSDSAMAQYASALQPQPSALNSVFQNPIPNYTNNFPKTNKIDNFLSSLLESKKVNKSMLQGYDESRSSIPGQQQSANNQFDQQFGPIQTQASMQAQQGGSSQQSAGQYTPAGGTSGQINVAQGDSPSAAAGPVSAPSAGTTAAGAGNWSGGTSGGSSPTGGGGGGY